MKVLVVGANGQVGAHLVSQLSQSHEHSVTAMVRKQEQAAAYEKRGIATILADLEGTVDELVKAIQESHSDAIVFTAGSGGSTGYDKTLLIDLDGAVKMIEAAERANVQRFIMVSALQAQHREHWVEAIKPYYVAKHYADKILENSSLNFTIIRPGHLLNEPSLDKIHVAENISSGSIPREDVAKVIMATLSEQATYRRSFDLISGEEPIESALEQL